MSRERANVEVSANAVASAGESARSNRSRCVSSRQLFAGARELRIEHADEVYLLRQTSSGKLLLTK